MLRWLIALTLLPFLGAATVTAAAPASAATCSDQVVQQTLHVADATAPGGTREVLVFRPPGADSSAYPVMYFLHGGPGEASDIYQAGIVDTLDQQLCMGRKFVVAVPDGTTVAKPDGTWWDNEWADDPGGHFDLETFITGPLIHAVEGQLIRPMTERSIAGFSMGAMGAAAIGERHKTLYGSVVGIAGYYTKQDDPDHALGSTTAEQQQHLPAALVNNGQIQHWFLADGRQDDNPIVVGETSKMMGLRYERKFDTTEYFVDGGHTWAMVGAVLPTAFQWWKNRLPQGAV